MVRDDREDKTKLTAAEKRRLEHFENIRQSYQSAGYELTELTVGALQANVMAILLMLPVAAWVFYVYQGRHGSVVADGGSMIVYFLFFIEILILALLHEVIHGITWGIFAPDHFESIEFGFIKEYLTPYCTCKVPLKKYQYILGTAMPLIVTGLLPAAAAIAQGNIWLLYVGAAMIFSAGGDTLIILKVLGCKTEAEDVIYLDHPTKVGLVMFER